MFSLLWVSEMQSCNSYAETGLEFSKRATRMVSLFGVNDALEDTQRSIANALEVVSMS